MAQHLARIFGTEEDKVNCPFYFKIGSCRHGDKCSRIHHKPAFSTTVLFQHMYQKHTKNFEQEHFLTFYEDIFLECAKYGDIIGLHIVDNAADHMVGHVYVQYVNEEMAADALEQLQGRYYDGVEIRAEYSPVTDFREARCRDYDETACSRSGFCNFLHCKPVPECLTRSLEEDADIAREDDRRRSRDNGNNGGGDGSSKRRRDDRKKSSSRKSSSSKRSRRGRSDSS